MPHPHQNLHKTFPIAPGLIWQVACEQPAMLGELTRKWKPVLGACSTPFPFPEHQSEWLPNLHVPFLVGPQCHTVSASLSGDEHEPSTKPASEEVKSKYCTLQGQLHQKLGKKTDTIWKSRGEITQNVTEKNDQSIVKICALWWGFRHRSEWRVLRLLDEHPNIAVPGLENHLWKPCLLVKTLFDD